MTTSRSVGLVGRRDELAALGADGPGGAMVVLTGERGSGRTALLGDVAATARAAGRVVLSVNLGGRRAAWDQYGVAPLLDAVSAQFEDLGAATDLMRSTAALRRRCSAAAFSSANGRASVRSEMWRLLTCLERDALVLLDDVDQVPNPVPLALTAREVGHRVIAAAGPLAKCSDLADTLVRLDPLTDPDVEHLLRYALRARPDPVLVETLRRALGPLAGNPAHILAMLDRLRGAGRLVTVARRVCLRAPNRTPTLPSDVPAVAAVGEPGGLAENLLLVVGGPARIRADDVPLLAAALGRTVRETGYEVDRLVAEKTLEEHGGRLLVRCPAVDATVRERASAARVRALHAAVALAAVDPAHDDLPRLDQDVLADHVVAAGAALAPDPAWESMLRGQARDEERRRPERAARLLLASGRHGTGGRATARTTEWAVRLLLRAGDHDVLARLVADVVAAGEHEPATAGGVDPELLAAAAAVAALTLRRPVPTAVHAALAEAEPAGCPLRVVQRWTEGESPSASELLRSLAALAGDDPAHRRRSSDALRAAEAALSERDVVDALRRLLGPAYAGSYEGPLALLRRVFAAYRGGRWDEATSAARAMFADHGSDARATTLRERAALFATDIAILQGDERMAEAWREYLPERPTGSLNRILHGYVRAAVLWVAGDAESALAQGWGAWNAVPPGAYALVRRALLTRLSGIAAADRRRGWNSRLVHAADEWSRVAWGAEATEAAETRDLVRGILEDGAPDRAALERTVERSRERGHRIDLGWVLLGVAARDPAPGWSEAQAIASDLHTPAPQARLRRFMDEHGLRPPRARPEGLTDVQLRILELVEQGMTNRQIARNVRMSEKTVENHLTRLFVRFGCRTRHGLATARLAARRGELVVGGERPWAVVSAVSSAPPR